MFTKWNMNEWMNEWMMHLYSAFCVLLYTQSALQSCGGVCPQPPPDHQPPPNMQLIHSLRANLGCNYHYYQFSKGADEISNKTTRRFPIKGERKLQKQGECWKAPVQLNSVATVSIFHSLRTYLYSNAHVSIRGKFSMPWATGVMTVWLEIGPTPPKHLNNKSRESNVAVQNRISLSDIYNK